MTEAFRSDRVAYSESVSDIYDTLREDSGSIEVSPFRTFKDIFMFAVFLGFKKGVRQKMPSGPKKTIRLEVFSREDQDLLRAVALASDGSPEVLRSPSEVITIIEEYAHAGIYDLKTELLGQGGKVLWNLLELVNSDSILVKND
ncbi:hypothetical protein GCM10017784_27730 [Deinococcus indicus]|uniref:hypothetical protein n=1 Tax=Deinococcus indicus TaxID=223556 RepID=UPI00174DE191|nr:hypothetical protein [Deinococcus indicus]GHG32637.1 hypothetical protein GCM10017784_27730 [Deinococcus indicus]